MFLSCSHFVVITTFSTDLVGVENVVITTKGLQDRNNLLLDERTVKNKGKLILTEIFPSVQNMTFKSIEKKDVCDFVKILKLTLKFYVSPKCHNGNLIE